MSLVDENTPISPDQLDANNEMNNFLDKLPAMPKPIYDYTEQDKRIFKYEGDLKDTKRRLQEKLYHVWKLWAHVHENPIVNEILKNVPKNKDCDEYKAKTTIITMLDIIGKIFNQTNTIEELFF